MREVSCVVGSKPDADSFFDVGKGHDERSNAKPLN